MRREGLICGVCASFICLVAILHVCVLLFERMSNLRRKTTSWYHKLDTQQGCMQRDVQRKKSNECAPSPHETLLPLALGHLGVPIKGEVRTISVRWLRTGSYENEARGTRPLPIKQHHQTPKR